MSDTNCIKNLLDRYSEAVRTQNKKNLRSVFSTENECTMIAITDCYEGIDSICGGFLGERLHKYFAEFTISPDQISINQIDDTHAIILNRFVADCVRKNDGQPYTFTGMETLIAVKEKDEWKLVHVHFSRER